MPDDPSSDRRTPVPGLVEVLSVETVEPLVNRHEQELAALRLELADALHEAEAAEQSLARHPAAAIFDDAFEADVLAQVAESLSKVPGSRAQDRADAVPETRPAPPRGPDTQVSSGSDEPFQPVAARPPSPGPGPGPSARPRTTVVERGNPGPPRTVVVDRGRPSSGPPPPPPPPPPSTGAPVLAGDPGAAQFVNSQASAEVPATSIRRRRGRKGKSKGNLLARLPARVLIQAGVVVVIVALLMLKLA